jgi:outer membrane cobalamin receptor
MDVLRLIPGFEFGTDVQGVACLGIRGNSANEGGLLVLVDGMEMTEILYASNNFGSIYPIDQIRKIEVIRGPGSVLYGGFAVYAVINILTKASEKNNGFHVANTTGITGDGSFRLNSSASFAAMYEKINFSIAAGSSSANRGDGIYTDQKGQRLDLTKKSRLTDQFISLRLNAGKFQLKALGDFYRIQNQTNYGDILHDDHVIEFQNLNLLSTYDFDISETFVVQPFFSIRRQSPWHVTDEIDTEDSLFILPFHTHANRLAGGLNANWKPISNFELIGNTGYWRESSHDIADPESGLSTSFHCFTSYLQGFWKNPVVNISAGLRFDNHSYYRPILSPRIALSKTIGNHYLKASYNYNFRTPAIANIVFRLKPVIEPQITRYYEAEYGARIGKYFNLALNVFQVNVDSGIVYQIIDNTNEGYSNGGKFGTRGIEGQLNFRNNHGLFLSGAWSFYANTMKNPGGNYFVPGTRVNLAYPAHKFFLNGSFPVVKNLKVNTTLHFLSERYGFNGDAENPFYLKYGPVIQWNFFLDWQNVYIEGLNLGFGIFDVTNSGYSLIQPYKSFHLPMAALSREFTFRITYGLNPEKI